jgi:hypothetical protein
MVMLQSQADSLIQIDPDYWRRLLRFGAVYG